MAPQAPRQLSILGGPPLWMKLALCKDMKNEIFFISKGQRPDAAIEICNKCPVRKECDEYAEKWDIGHGVWGGENKTTR